MSVSRKVVRSKVVNSAPERIEMAKLMTYDSTTYDLLLFTFYGLTKFKLILKYNGLPSVLAKVAFSLATGF
jgi:predicted secreted protein